MNSIILQIAAKYVRWLLIVFSVVALLRGHNYPGGGFIGGLLAALAIVYNGFAFDIKLVYEKLRIKPQAYISLGLLLIGLSLLPSIINGDTLMTGIWTSISIPLMGELKLGTPFLFDIGVFSAVVGVTLLFFFSLTQNE